MMRLSENILLKYQVIALLSGLDITFTDRMTIRGVKKNLVQKNSMFKS